MRTLADYTSRDVAAEDLPAYSKHVEMWQAELSPNGALECYFSAEIVRAAWRMEHYAPLGPEISENAGPDRARAAWLRHRERTSLGIRRNLEELRRLQSDRFLQAHLGIHLPGVASLKTVLPALKEPKKHAETPSPAPKQPEAAPPATIQRSEAILHAQIQDEERRQLEEFRKRNPPPQWARPDGMKQPTDSGRPRGSTEPRR